MRHSSFRSLWLSLSVVLAAGPVAQAVVLDIQANVTAEVQELVGGSVVNSDYAFDELDLTTHNLPFVAEAKLWPPSAAQASAPIDVAAVSTSRFSDPRIDQTQSPNEFALSTIGFSSSEVSSVTGHALAVETRQIVFEAEDVGLAADTPVTARSHFFLDGIMVLLAAPGQSGLAGAKTEIRLRITQTRADESSAVVFETTVMLTGNADGTATLTASGALLPDNATTFGLNGVGGTEGTFQAAVLADLAIPYEYPANIGETFELRAEVETRFEAPPGAGGAVILGDQLNQLVSVLQNAIGADVVANFAAGLTAGLSGISLPLKPLVATEQDTILEPVADSARGLSFLSSSGCGLLGAESALISAGLAVMSLSARRRA